MIALDAYTRLPRFPGQGRGFQALTRLLPYASVRARHLDGVRLSGPGGDLTYMFAAMLRGDDLIGRTIREAPSNTSFVDIGANIGAYALLAARYCRDVFAVEPHPRTFSYLVRNIEINRALNVYMCCAAVDRSGQRMVSLGFDAGHSGGACLNGDRDHSILVLTLNREWFDHLPVDRALVKVDVEGAEGIVVRELLRSRLAPQIEAMLIEVRHDLGGNAAGALLDDLTGAGFHEVDRETGDEADDVLFRRG